MLETSRLRASNSTICRLSEFTRSCRSRGDAEQSRISRPLEHCPSGTRSGAIRPAADSVGSVVADAANRAESHRYCRIRASNRFDRRGGSGLRRPTFQRNPITAGWVRRSGESRQPGPAVYSGVRHDDSRPAHSGAIYIADCERGADNRSASRGNFQSRRFGEYGRSQSPCA